MSDVDEEDFDAAPDAEDDGAVVSTGRDRGESDVLLDVPELRIDEISLEVQDLKAHVSLEADVLELLKLHAGVDAVLGGVQLTITGVEAQVLLKVHLDAPESCGVGLTPRAMLRGGTIGRGRRRGGGVRAGEQPSRPITAHGAGAL